MQISMQKSRSKTLRLFDGDSWKYDFPKYVGLVILLLLLLFPFYEMSVTALKSNADLFRKPIPWLPAQPAFSNFIDIWSYQLGNYFVSSLIIAIGATLVNTVGALPAGYALARMQFPGRKVFMQVIMATQMFSPIVLLMGAYKLMVFLNLIDSYWSLIFMDATVALPFSVWLLTTYFSTVPKEIEEAALIDGAGRIRMLFSLFIPVILPGIAATVIFTFIGAWNEFIFALSFITDPDKKPLTTGIYSFIGQYDIQWNLLMAASLVAIVPVLIMFLVVQRWLVSGLTVGAVKG
jgi:multiple sugar transport system permease protein